MLLGSYLLYTVLAASFLSLGGLAWLTEDGNRFRIETAGGYSLFPGRLHVRGLKIFVRDHNVDMEISADRAEASIALAELPFKRVHISWIRTHGTEYKLVYPVQASPDTAERRPAFPKLSGFDGPLDPATRPPATRRGKKWSAKFDQIEGDVRLVWILEYRLQGTMQARGAFSLDPSREVRVLPCEVVVESAEIMVDRWRIAHGVQGTLRAKVDAFPPRDTAGRDVISRVSAGVEGLRAELDTLSFIRLYARSDRISWEGSGRLGLQARMDRGQLQDGSTGALELSRLVVRAGTASARGTGAIALRAAPQGQLGVEASLLFPEAERAAFSSEQLQAKVSLEHRNVTDLKVRRTSLLVKELHFKTPDFLKGLFGNAKGVPSSATFDAEATLDSPNQGAAKLDVEVATRSTSFYLSGLRFGVTADARLHCNGSRAEASCALDAHAPSLRFDQRPGDSSATLWLRTESVGPLRVNAQAGTLSGTIRLVGGDPKDAVSEVIGSKWIAQLGLALVPSGDLAGQLHVKRTPALLSLTAIELSHGASRVQGHLNTAGTTTGAWIVELPTSRWGFALKPGGLATHPFVGRDWLDTH